jgi:hypothetical protein
LSQIRSMYLQLSLSLNVLAKNELWFNMSKIQHYQIY